MHPTWPCYAVISLNNRLLKANNKNKCVARNSSNIFFQTTIHEKQQTARQQLPVYVSFYYSDFFVREQFEYFYQAGIFQPIQIR